MKHWLFLILSILALNSGWAQDKKNDEAFLVRPYLQLGAAPTPSALDLLWQDADKPADWQVETRANDKSAWKRNGAPVSIPVAVTGITPRSLYKATMSGLVPGGTFEYRVLKNNKIVFTSRAKALKSAEQPYRCVVFGDIGAGTTEAKQLAGRAFLSNPDMVVVPGDIVYDHGLISEYDTRFWPVYNAAKADSAGAPIMCSVPFVAAPGNHDTDTRDLDRFPDGLAYFLFWDQPLNGPPAPEGGPLTPVLKATPASRNSFVKAAGDAYPRMANFSFNYGNAHWLFLDANPYVDFTSREIKDWITKDLADAKDATWRFVVFHHPGFNSSIEHYEQQQARLLSPLFETGNVDIVFNGHVHNYQRSFPMRFTPDNNGTLLVGGKDGNAIRGRVVNGHWKLDKSFNGKTDTTPEGVIYVVTGAGGQELYNPEQQNDPDSWQRFTDKFVSTIHSLTMLDVNGKTCTLTQVATDGSTLDTITITK